MNWILILSGTECGGATFFFKWSGKLKTDGTANFLSILFSMRQHLVKMGHNCKQWEGSDIHIFLLAGMGANLFFASQKLFTFGRKSIKAENSD